MTSETLWSTWASVFLSFPGALRFSWVAEGLNWSRGGFRDLRLAWPVFPGGYGEQGSGQVGRGSVLSLGRVGRRHPQYPVLR